MLRFDQLETAIAKAEICQEFCFCVRIVRLSDGQVLYCSLSSEEADCLDLRTELTAARAENVRGEYMLCIGKNQEMYEVTGAPLRIADQDCVLEMIQPHNRILSMLSGSSDESQSAGTYRDAIGNLVLKDTLTGLYNRRYIDEFLPAALNRAYEQEKPLSVIFADIDHFKLVNDTHGHIAGDLVLQHVAQLLQKHIRSSDCWVARYGGDEFVICLPGVTPAAAQRIANRLRVAIMGERFVFEGGAVRLTCSFGVHSVSKNDFQLSAMMLLHRADEKLYQAKHAGRNAVV